MPRLRQVPRAEVTDDVILSSFQHLFGDRDPVAEPGTATGSPGDWWTVFALVPDVFRHAVQGFFLYSSDRRKLAPHLRELSQARAGYAAGSRFVFSQHCKALRALGDADEKVEALPHWQVAACFSEIERAVLAYTDCLVLDRGRTPDCVFAVLRGNLSDEEILELTYIASMYGMHAVMSRALRTEFDDVPELVAEVLGADDPAAYDFWAGISRPAGA